MLECLKLSGGRSGKTEKAIIRGTDPSRKIQQQKSGSEDLGNGEDLAAPQREDLGETGGFGAKNSSEFLV
jgi:hypothetical protein